MKYSYFFERDSFGFLMIKLPKELGFFSHFIEEIVTEDLVDEIIENIDSVQRREKGEEEIMINAPTVTSVSLSDILDEPPPDQYIEKDEFRKLILIWREKLPVRFIDGDDDEVH